MTRSIVKFLVVNSIKTNNNRISRRQRRFIVSKFSQKIYLSMFNENITLVALGNYYQWFSFDLLQRDINTRSYEYSSGSGIGWIYNTHLLNIINLIIIIRVGPLLLPTMHILGSFVYQFCV